MINVAHEVQMLRNDANYYGAYGARFMSNTDVKNLIDDPLGFKQGSIDAANLAKGRLSHVLLFEPHKAHSLKLSGAKDRRGADYKADCARLGESYLMLKRDFEEMAALVSRVKANMEIFELLFPPGAVYEDPNVFAYKGLWWKTKADSNASARVVDFKSTGDLSRFKYAAKEYCYDSQAFLYGMSYKKPVIFVVGEKGTGKLGVFECTQDFLESGRQKVIQALSNYDKYHNPETKSDEPINYFLKQTL